MSIESEIFDELRATFDRVLPAGKVELGTLMPCVTYQRISTRRLRSHDGTSAVQPLFQIDCWADSALSARVAGGDVIEIFEPQIGHYMIDDDRGPRWDPDAKLYRRTVDVRVHTGAESEVS